MPVADIRFEAGMIPEVGGVFATMEFAKRQVLRIIKDLTPEQLAQRPDGFNNSIAALVVHCAGTEVYFAHALRGREVPPDLRAEFLLDQEGSGLPQPSGETVETLTAKLEKARGIIRETFMSLTAEDLERIMGKPEGFQYAIRWQVALASFHMADHFGQMVLVKQHLTVYP